MAWIRRYIDRLRFRQKLILSYLIISIIPILFLGIYSYNQSKDFLYQQAAKDYQRNVEVYSESIKANMDHYENMAALILYNDIIQRILNGNYIDLYNLYNDLTQYLNPYLNMLLNLNTETQQLTLYTANEMPEYGDYIQRIERITDQAWYKTVSMAKGTTWFHEGNELFLAGKFPLRYSPGEKAAPSAAKEEENILYIRVNNRNLFSNLPDSIKEQWVFLLDSAGNPVYSSHDLDEQTSGVFAMIKDNPKAVIQIGGSDMMLIKENIPNTDWYLYCLVPDKDILQNSGSIVRATLIVVGICLLILIIIISVFAKSMIRRIYKLNNWMKRAEQGELELRVQSTSKDEIGELTNRFGDMLKQINGLINERYKNKIIQKEAELKAIKSQISPHFLYNTLSFINWKALESDNHEISQMVTSLSQFYRTALNRGDNIISVRDEINNMKSYLEIVLATSDLRFDVVYQIDEEVYSYGMINLILQPIVENAIKHGIKKKKTGKGLLVITGRVLGETIEFSICDNGPGIEPAVLEQLLRKHSTGYGLKHVDDRIKLVFGSEYGLSIQSGVGSTNDSEDVPETNLRTSMLILIPKQIIKSV